MTVKQICNDAAKRLRKEGWCQGSYGRMAEKVPALADRREVKAGSPCGAAGNLVGTPVAETDIIGALRQVGGSDPNVDKAKEAVRKLIGGGNLADWNDDEHRTMDDVCAVLERAAA